MELFEDYIRSGLYLRGWSPKTEIIYRRAWKSFTRFQESLRPASDTPVSGDLNVLTKAHLEQWVISRREAGMSPSGINIYIRAMNSFSGWLKEEAYIDHQVVIKQLKAPSKPVVVFSDKDISLILSFKPRGFYELRTWTLLVTLLDTGLRIHEAVSLMRSKIDFDNMLLEVLGKGGKQRRVPFSQELRKSLYRFSIKNKTGTLFFGTRDGHELRYRNIYRDLINLCQKVGITKRVHPHLTRHTFACHFMKNGGSIYTLSRILGHSSVSTTQIYIRGLGVEDFQEEHSRLSPLVRR